MFRQSLIRLGLYGAGVGVALLVSAPLVLDVVYGAGFSDAVAPLGILGIGLIPALLRGGLTLVHYAFHNERGVNRINGVTLGLQVIAGLALIPVFGAAGGALAVVAGDAAAWWLLQRGRSSLALPQPERSA